MLHVLDWRDMAVIRRCHDLERTRILEIVNCAAQAEVKGLDRVLRDCFSSFTFQHNVIVGGAGGWPKDNKAVKAVPANWKNLGADVETLRNAVKDVRYFVQ